MLISPESWNHIFVSKHHYAVYLAKRGNRVFFLNPPTNFQSIEGTDFENVFSVNYSGFPRGLRFYPSNLQRYFIKAKFLDLQRLCEVTFDVIWSFDNSVFFDFSALPSELVKISHIVDLNQDFQTAKAASTANFCFCTTEQIKGRLLNYNTRVFKINHGFNSQAVDSAGATLAGKSKIKALYSGNLAIPFIDWSLIRRLAHENPEIDFIFIGPNKEAFAGDVQENSAKQDVLISSNCFFIGKVESKDLLPYLIAADVLLVTYKEGYHADQAANPHKMMEYLGAGKMIVATHTEEYRDLADKDLFLMSSHNSEFYHLFSKAVDEIEFWNSKEKRDSRKSIASHNSYVEQIHRIEKILNTWG